MFSYITVSPCGLSLATVVGNTGVVSSVLQRLLVTAKRISARSDALPAGPRVQRDRDGQRQVVNGWKGCRGRWTLMRLEEKNL